MSNQTPADPNGPLMRAWENYKATDEYSNTRNWARISEHTDGSLWAAFECGFTAGLAASPEPPRCDYHDRGRRCTKAAGHPCGHFCRVAFPEPPAQSPRFERFGHLHGRVTEPPGLHESGKLDGLGKPAAPAPAEPVCEWVYQEHESSDYYDTACGEAYCLIDGTLAENKYEHCPNCGKKIKARAEPVKEA